MCECVSVSACVRVCVCVCACALISVLSKVSQFCWCSGVPVFFFNDTPQSRVAINRYRTHSSNT